MEKPQNLILVIFGASGDLTKRKLVPALYDLYKQNLLPDGFAILGVGRTQLSDDTFRTDMGKGIKTFSNEGSLDDSLVKDFLLKLHYLSINTKSPEDYALLKNKLSALDSVLNSKENFIYYLAIPPDMYEVVTANIGRQERGSQVQGNLNCQKSDRANPLPKTLSPHPPFGPKRQ